MLRRKQLLLDPDVLTNKGHPSVIRFDAMKENGLP